MHILLAVSEVAPYAKTGGLADVASALPKALAALGEQVTVVMPRYGFIHTGEEVWYNLPVPFAHTIKHIRLFRESLGKATIYWIDAPEYFSRGKAIYGESDDPERFAFFCRAVLEVARWLGTPPDIIHCNDWMTGLIPVYLRTVYATDPYFAGTATLLSIHNLAFQGLFSPSQLPRFGLSMELNTTDGGLEFRGTASMLKGGLVATDAISTVSKKYAQEIQTAEYGFKMEGLLHARRHDLIGILNGVDYDIWNPATDKNIAANYSMEDLSGKRLCKADLLSHFHLPHELDRPLIAVVSRISDQKGFDLIREVSGRMLQAGAFFVLLGSGDSQYEDFFQRLRDFAPHRVGVYFGFNNELAHRIEAGADIFLMPSWFEPCGLNQIYSLKYGTVPIVRATGGLDDTIQDFDRITRTGNGFKFRAYRADRLIEKIYEALLLYNDQDLWKSIMLNGMRANHSWEVAAHEYLDVYRILKHTIRERM